VKEYKFIYFLGIGGIGMSALARYFNHYKVKVVGYDKTQTELTDSLINEGIEVYFEEDVTRLKSSIVNFKKEDVLIVYTPAIPDTHSEYIFLLNNHYTIKKRAEVLGEITSKFKTIAVAGTHGKTTTSSLIAHVLKTANLNVYAFLGGITKNYETNLLLGNDEITNNTYLVVEADEYDRSFLTLHPDYAIITSVDADHLDIYKSETYMHQSYELFSKQLKKGGFLLVKKNVDNTICIEGKRHTYDVSLSADYYAENIKIEKDQFFFDYVSPNVRLDGLLLGIPGNHNIENAVAAITVALQIGINQQTIVQALRSFKGVKRRFDYRVKSDKVIYIDDYAHHPEELKAFISAAKSLYPSKKITGVFQPHLFSRTKDFADEFAKSLDLLDEAILLEIYPAREKPIDGVNAQLLLNKMLITEKTFCSKENLLELVRSKNIEVLLTMGAGDIDQLCEPIQQLLLVRHEKN